MYWVGSIASAEVYDPSTETWSRVGDMPEETVRLAAWQYTKPAILLESQDDRQGAGSGRARALGGAVRSVFRHMGLCWRTGRIKLGLRHVNGIQARSSGAERCCK